MNTDFRKGDSRKPGGRSARPLGPSPPPGVLIDWSRISELRSEVGTEDFDEIVTLFLHEVQRALAAMPEDGTQVHDLAERLHFLKGSALNLGFARMSALCESGEQAATAGRRHAVDLEALRACFDRSRSEFHAGFRAADPAAARAP